MLILPSISLIGQLSEGVSYQTIQYVGGLAQAWANATSPDLDIASGLTGGIGGGLQENDLVLVFFMISDVTTGTPADPTITTSGYTALSAVLSQSDTNRSKLRGWYKFMGASPDSIVDIGNMTGDQSAAASARVYRGVDLTTPLDVAVATAGGTNSGQPNPPNCGPSVTPGCAGIMCAAASADNNMTSAEVIAEIDAYQAASGSHAGSGILTGHLLGMGLGDSLNPTTSGGSSNGNDCWNAYTLLLRPALA